jgi:hypothetical protein
VKRRHAKSAQQLDSEALARKPPRKTPAQLDYEATRTLIAKQRELHQQLNALAEKLLTLNDQARDHAAGYRHASETCTTCAAIEKEQR